MQVNKNKVETTGSRYYAYEKVVKKVEEWIVNIDPHVVGCTTSQVRERVVQRIIELTNESYCQQLPPPEERYGALQIEKESEKLHIEGIVICLESGKVSLFWRQWVKQLLLFLATWLQQLFFLIISIFGSSPKVSQPTTFLFDTVPGCENDDAKFVAFARKGHIAPLRNASHVIIKMQNRPKSPSDSSFSYTPEPLSYFITNFLTRKVKVSALLAHLTAPLYYFKAIVDSPINVLLGRDVANIPLIKSLDKQGLFEAIIKTTSAFSVQYLWEKGLENPNFKLHMIWYSQNFIPKMYHGDEKRPDLPAARHMRVDVHWVWTEGFKDYLCYLGQNSTINAIGPILWYLPEPVEIDSEAIKVSVFDITPIPDTETAFGAMKNYYSVKTIKQFMIDIMIVCDELAEKSGRKILILLKHKRPPKVGRHDSAYIEFIKELESTKHNFKLLDNEINLFGLLNDSDLSISVPYTSTAYVSAKEATPAIYYDPFMEIVPQYEKNSFVEFAAGKDELRRLMELQLRDI